MSKHRTWTPESVLAALAARLDSGALLNYQAVVREDEALTGAARRLFGSWDAAITAAGLDPQKIKRPSPIERERWDRSRVLVEIQQRRETGLSLSAHDVQVEHAKLYGAAVHYFGSWKAAVEALGEDYEGIRKNREWSKEQIVDLLRSAYKAGADLSDHTLDALNSPLYGAIQSQFGSLREALQSADIPYDQVRRTREWTESEVRRYAKRAVNEGVSLSALAHLLPGFGKAARRCFGSLSTLANEIAPKSDAADSVVSLLKTEREAAGLSKSELGRRVGSNHTQIRHFETGEATPDLPMALALAQALHVAVDDLFGLQNQENDETPVPKGKMQELTTLDEVLTVSEAARMWSLEDSTIKKRCESGRFAPGEYRKADRNWLMLRSAMERVYGPEKLE